MRRGSKLAQVIALAAMAAAAFVAVAVGAAPSAAAATGERIVFVSDRDGNWELYTMNGDGSSPTRLTFDPRADVDPTISASDGRIAFARGLARGLTRGRFTASCRLDRQDDSFDIYVMDADGSNVRRLTRDAATNSCPSFSPDGSKIAFASGRRGIDVMNADGSGRVSLTGDGGDPAWSPDGSKIAFARNSDIYLMNADGSAPARLTTAEGDDLQPAWSPDGRRIVFHRERIGPTFAIADDEIFVINADGSGERQVTENPPRPTGTGDRTSYPSWSPDGTRIAFARGQDLGTCCTPAGDTDGSTQEIHVMNADGSGPRALTTNTARDRDPAFAAAAPPGGGPSGDGGSGAGDGGGSPGGGGGGADGGGDGQGQAGPLGSAGAGAGARGNPGGDATASARCLPRSLRVGPRGMGNVRIGATRAEMTRAAGRPSTRARTSFRYCVRGGGRVLVAFDRAGRARLIATTAPHQRARGVGRGAPVATLRGRYRGLRRIHPGLYTTNGRTSKLFGVRRGRVRFVAVVDRSLLPRRRQVLVLLRRVRL